MIFTLAEIAIFDTDTPSVNRLTPT